MLYILFLLLAYTILDFSIHTKLQVCRVKKFNFIKLEILIS